MWFYIWNRSNFRINPDPDFFWQYGIWIRIISLMKNAIICSKKILFENFEADSELKLF
jgi:hypothetical protein